jgi:hypothetical protein
MSMMIEVIQRGRCEIAARPLNHGHYTRRCTEQKRAVPLAKSRKQVLCMDVFPNKDNTFLEVYYFVPDWPVRLQ